jgi:hypothetical protein
MTYKRLGDGTYAVGFPFEGRFIAWASAFDQREARALLRAINAVIDLFHATSGAWVTIAPGGKAIPRGSSAKATARKPRVAARRTSGRKAAR